MLISIWFDTGLLSVAVVSVVDVAAVAAFSSTTATIWLALSKAIASWMSMIEIQIKPRRTWVNPPLLAPPNQFSFLLLLYLFCWLFIHLPPRKTCDWVACYRWNQANFGELWRILASFGELWRTLANFSELQVIQEQTSTNSART